MEIKSNYQYLIDILQEMSGGEAIIDNGGFIPMDIVVQAITQEAEKNGGTIKPKPNTDLPEIEWAEPVITDDYIPVEGDYFYIRSLEDNNTIYVTNTEYNIGKWIPSLDYSYDQENWQPAAELTDIVLNKNEKIYFKNNGNTITNTDGNGFCLSDKYIAAGGNVRRALSTDDSTVISCDYLFKNNKMQGGDLKLVGIDKYSIFGEKYENGYQMFQGNQYLYSVDFQDNIVLTNGNSAFRGCKLLHNLSPIRLENATNMNYMFESTPNLKKITFSKFSVKEGVNNLSSHVFWNCGMQELEGDFSALSTVKNFSDWFWDCRNLRKYNRTINLSSGVTFDRYLDTCVSMDCTTLPNEFVVNPNAHEFRFMFQSLGRESDKPFIKAPLINTANGTALAYMFYDCPFLETIPKINLSKARNSDSTESMFGGCVSLKNITFEGSINYSLSIPSAELTEETIKSALTAASNANNSESKTLDLGGSRITGNSDIQALLDACANKGWSINNLIIN